MAVFAGVNAPSLLVMLFAVNHTTTVSALFALTDAHMTPLLLMTNIFERAGRVWSDADSPKGTCWTRPFLLSTQQALHLRRHQMLPLCPLTDHLRKGWADALLYLNMDSWAFIVWQQSLTWLVGFPTGLLGEWFCLILLWIPTASPLMWADRTLALTEKGSSDLPSGMSGSLSLTWFQSQLCWPAAAEGRWTVR